MNEIIIVFISSFVGTMSAALIFGVFAYKKIKKKLDETMFGGI